jgi:serine/threonine protein phosphatase PrpC
MLHIAEWAHNTDPGRARRENEDAFHVAPPLFVLADGMGGAQAGEVASRLAAEAFSELPSDGSAEERLAAAGQAANERIHEMARTHRDRAGMGTTITAALAGEREVTVAHVGDSRAYRLRDGRLEPLTRDHSLVQTLIDEGRLSREEARHHPQRSVITRVLGVEPRVEVETHTWPAHPDDVYLLCSDGLTDMVDEETVGRIVARADSLEAASRALIDAANAAGGRDNITVLLFRVDGDGPRDHDGADERGDEDQTPASVETGPPRTATHASVARERPVPSSSASGRRRRRIPRVIRVGSVVVLILLPILAGGWIASRAVYFIGTDDGFVTVFRGLPYDGPFGAKLYQREYVSGVPRSAVPAARREKLLDHSLRSQEDARDLIRQLELGRIAR